ncbi:NUDIX hydrolase [Phytomonospora endophytica]|uniref:ADP-ribose pyrophosphatase YjhB (NUDIX family) n=1 Tax=Phytomonospora endophytica TaxID=714109 RepID=A0A841FQR9_9ACTN|nr:NUDIX domain-containing protein [Phytomonospora endophytica]MBB6034310.1 ADP-ribose pyrophosphatase YjhB (NUDIX family) [Phytomonospora endophytica]GIG66704.1 NUDIX hydrolase [Phytomonospora endophytica]
MNDTPMHSVAMVGVVERDGRVLCIERMDNGRWEPPAGVLELDETFETGVEREVLEETGVAVKALWITGVHKEFGHPKRPVTMIWRCEYVGGEATPTEEARTAAWLTRDEVQRLVRPAHAIRILDALEAPGQAGPRIVYHDGNRPLEDPVPR